MKKNELKYGDKVNVRGMVGKQIGTTKKPIKATVEFIHDDGLIEISMVGVNLFQLVHVSQCRRKVPKFPKKVVLDEFYVAFDDNSFGKMVLDEDEYRKLVSFEYQKVKLTIEKK